MNERRDGLNWCLWSEAEDSEYTQKHVKKTFFFILSGWFAFIGWVVLSGRLIIIILDLLAAVKYPTTNCLMFKQNAEKS